MHVPIAHLTAALFNGRKVGSINLVHHTVGKLSLPSGRLVACDPFVCPEPQPFWLALPQGTFPLTLSVAEIGSDQRVAFALLNISDSSPVRWKMLTTHGQKLSDLKDEEVFGYPVDSGTGCFADVSAMGLLIQKMRNNENYFDTLSSEMDKTYTNTWSWLNVSLDEANVIAFSSGYGDGVYASYAGFDSRDRPSAIVTDFGVLPWERQQPIISGTAAKPSGPATFWSRLKLLLTT